MKINLQEHANSADKNWGDLYYHIIPKLIRDNNFKNFVEIGVAFGGHLENILLNTEIEKSYGVDSYLLSNTTTDNFVWGNKKYEQDDYENLYKFTIERLEKFGERVKIIRKNSLEAAQEFIDESLDIIFIDGEHTYESVKNDLEVWSKKIRRGGIISGHDYNHPHFPDVKKIIDFWCTNNNFLLNIEEGYIWWIKKNK